MKKIVTGIWICIAFLCIGNLEVYGATVNVTVGSVDVAQGETVNVPVTLSADAVMGVAEIYVSYDSAYLEYNSAGEGAGGAGMVKFVFSEMDETGKGKTFNISFTGKAAGTTTVAIDDNTRVLAFEAPDPEQADMQLAITNGQVNVTAPVEASSDCNLTELSFSAVKSSGDSVNVEFIPKFSPDILEYKADLPADITRLVVSTTLSDTKATTKVTGTRIDEGENRTTIIVVAEDGTQKSYILYTTRATQEPPSEEPPSEGQPSEEPPSEEQPTEAPTMPEIDRSPILIESLNKYMIQDFALISTPEGYEESYSTYNGRTVAVFRGINKPFALVSLADTPEGANASFYIMNEIDGNMTKLIDVTAGQKIYTVIPTGADYPGPEGYAHTMLDMNGDMINAWCKSEDSEFYVIYAMNYDGQANLYVYDSVEKTVQRFVQDNKPAEEEVETPTANFNDIHALQKKYQNLDEKYNAEKNRNLIIFVVLGVIIFILLIFAIVMMFKANVIKEDTDAKDEANMDVNHTDADNANTEEKKTEVRIETQEKVVPTTQKQDEKVKSKAEDTKQVEPVKTEPAKTEPVQNEIMKGETVQETPVLKENVQTETVKKETSQDAIKKEQIGSSEKVSTEKGDKTELSKKELSKTEQKRAEEIMNEEMSILKSDAEKIMQGLEFDSDTNSSSDDGDGDDLEIEFVDIE